MFKSVITRFERAEQELILTAIGVGSMLATKQNNDGYLNRTMMMNRFHFGNFCLIKVAKFCENDCIFCKKTAGLAIKHNIKRLKLGESAKRSGKSLRNKCKKIFQVTISMNINKWINLCVFRFRLN